MMNEHQYHKRKRGHKPAANCINCWLYYMQEMPEVIITAKDLLRILEAMHVIVLTWKVDTMWKATQIDKLTSIGKK